LLRITFVFLWLTRVTKLGGTAASSPFFPSFPATIFFFGSSSDSELTSFATVVFSCFLHFDDPFLDSLHPHWDPLFLPERKIEVQRPDDFGCSGSDVLNDAISVAITPFFTSSSEIKLYFLFKNKAKFSNEIFFILQLKIFI